MSKLNVYSGLPLLGRFMLGSALCVFVLSGVSAAPSYAEQAQADALVEMLDGETILAEGEDFHALEDILEYAFINNPSLRAARAELRATHELLPQAQSGWRPNIEASGNVTKMDQDGSNFGGDGTTSREVEVGFNQPLYRGGRTVASTDSATGRIMAQRALLDMTEQQFLLEVVAAYMNLLTDQAVVMLGRNNLDLINRQMEASRRRFEVGEITRTDVAQSEARLARARADLALFEGNMRKSRATYHQLTGLYPANLGYPVLDFPVPDTIDAAVDFAEQTSPAVAASEYFHHASERDVDTIFGELLPQLALLGSWNRQYDPQPGLIDQSTTKTIAVAATVPLYQAGATRSRVRQAKHTANQRYLEILETRRNVRERVVRSWEDLASARAEIDSRQAQVEASRIAREGVEQEAALGARTILDTLDADQEYLDAQVALVRAQRDEIVAEFSLLAAIGMLTPETLGFQGFRHEYDRHLRSVQWKILGMDVEIDRGGS